MSFRSFYGMRRTHLRRVSSRAGKPVWKCLQLPEQGVRMAEMQVEVVAMERMRQAWKFFRKYSCLWGVSGLAILSSICGGSQSEKELSFPKMMPNTSVHCQYIRLLIP